MDKQEKKPQIPNWAIFSLFLVFTGIISALGTAQSDPQFNKYTLCTILALCIAYFAIKYIDRLIFKKPKN